MKTAIILGGTGLTGRVLLNLLLENGDYGKIKLFSRSTIGITNPKLEEYLGDVVKLESFKDQFFADEIFCCIGTTKAKTPNRELYREIDFGIPTKAAAIAKEKGIPTLIVISALGANPKSAVFYNRLKGEMENAVLAAKIPKTYILQPSLISGKREERRFGEWIFKQLMKVANLVLAGPWGKYKSITPETIAACMVWLANNGYDSVKIESDVIKKIAMKI